MAKAPFLQHLGPTVRVNAAQTRSVGHVRGMLCVQHKFTVQFAIVLTLWLAILNALHIW
jgi:hypothetical protein